MKYAVLATLGLMFSFPSFGMTDCVVGKKIEYIRIGKVVNELNSTISVKFEGSVLEKVLNFDMDLDNPQGPSNLGILNSAMLLENAVTVRDSRDLCNEFYQIVTHQKKP